MASLGQGESNKFYQTLIQILLFLRVQLIIAQVFSGLGNGMAHNKWQAITWADDDQVHWCIYTSLNLNELNNISNSLLLSNHLINLFVI